MMPTDWHIQVTVAAETARSTELIDLLYRVLLETGVKRPDFGSWSAQPVDGDPPRVLLSFQLRAETAEAAQEALTGVEAGLLAAGEVLSEPPKVLSARPVKPNIGAPRQGIVYDEQTKQLTVDTWAPDWGDVEIDLIARDDGQVTALVAVGPPRREHSFVVRRLAIRRPAS